MKLRILTIIATGLALLVAPQVASAACPVGIVNELSVVPPATLAEGQTQRHNFSVTACTSKSKVTVEWVKIIQSNRPWLMDSSNRSTVVAETNVLTEDSTSPDGKRLYRGASSFTVPVGQMDGHYAVITRYYALGYVAPEAQGGSSFSLSTPDVCINLAGNQQTVPDGLSADGNGNCIVDECPNLGGVQATVPSPYVVDSGQCVIDQCPNLTGVQVTVPQPYVIENGVCVTDKCPNLDGLQSTIPTPYVIENGLCVTDKCPNLDGLQSTVPTPYVIENGVCVTDKCPNLTGLQSTVPTPYVIDNGNCVIDKCPNLDAVQTSLPDGYIVDAAGNCVTPPRVIVDPPKDVCPNLDGAQADVPTGYTLIAGECKIVATPTGDDPTPIVLKPNPWITKVANVKQTVTGGKITYTIKVGNRGPGLLKAARICDKLPAGTVYVAHSGTAAFANGSICWTPRNVAKGKSFTVKLTVKVSGSFKGKQIVNTACVTSANAAKKCAKAVVRVKVIRKEPVGGVTG